jgi:hypothetical protein
MLIVYLSASCIFPIGRFHQRPTARECCRSRSMSSVFCLISLPKATTSSREVGEGTDQVRNIRTTRDFRKLVFRAILAKFFHPEKSGHRRVEVLRRRVFRIVRCPSSPWMAESETRTCGGRGATHVLRGKRSNSGYFKPSTLLRP